MNPSIADEGTRVFEWHLEQVYDYLKYLKERMLAEQTAPSLRQVHGTHMDRTAVLRAVFEIIDECLTHRRQFAFTTIDRQRVPRVIVAEERLGSRIAITNFYDALGFVICALDRDVHRVVSTDSGALFILKSINAVTVPPVAPEEFACSLSCSVPSDLPGTPPEGGEQARLPTQPKTRAANIRKEFLEEAWPGLRHVSPKERGWDFGNCAETNPFITRFGGPAVSGYAVKLTKFLTDIPTAGSPVECVKMPMCGNCTQVCECAGQDISDVAAQRKYMRVHDGTRHGRAGADVEWVSDIYVSLPLHALETAVEAVSNAARAVGSAVSGAVAGASGAVHAAAGPSHPPQRRRG